jgi:hypothetical protein
MRALTSALVTFSLPVLLSCSLLVLTACGDDGGGLAADVVAPADVPAADVPPDLVGPTDVPAPPLDVPTPPPDVPPDAAPDVPADAAPDVPADVVVKPRPFRVGVAHALMNAPLGMGVSGNGPAPANGHVSPFSLVYPATDRILSPITVKAIALEGGFGQMIFVRLDAIGVLKEVRRSVVLELQERGVDVAEDDVLMVATHTHAAPARLINRGNLWNLIADLFWPQHYDRVVAGIADVVEAALADREPGRFGYAFGYTDEAHNDRRCENPELLDGTLPVLRFDRADGTPKAAVVVYAIHGTVVGTDSYAYSSDSGGAIEYKTQERLGAPVPVMFVNSWAGDVAPADPRGPAPEGPLPAIDRDTDRLEGIGNEVADAVMEVWDGIETTAEVEIEHASALVALSREALGYGADEFPYPWGAVYCGGTSGPSKCVGSEDPLPDPNQLISTCGQFPTEGEGVTSTWLSVYRIGELLLPTFPGEPVTQIAHNVIDGIRETSAWQGDIAFVGYAQDYVGYSETEEYWWYGGYEASGALWGPKQGDYLTAELLALVAHFVDPQGVPLAVHAAADFVIPDVPPNAPGNTIWEPEPSVVSGTVTEQPPAAALPHDIVRVSWTGGDPWMDHPRVVLEVQDDAGGWAPFLRDNGTALENDAYEFHLGLATEPTYLRKRTHTPRTFSWWAELPLMRIQPTTTAPLLGTFRFHIEGLRADDQGAVAPYEVTTDPFVVAAE